MTLERPIELMRAAVIRHGHKCSVCGRPCGEDEARRHTKPGAFGDSTMNFAAMCYACQTWLAHEGAQPAQYVTHFYDDSRTRRLVRRIASFGALALTIGSFAAFATVAGTIIYSTPHTVWNAFGTALLLVLLFSIGGGLLSGLLRGTGATQTPPLQRVHHTFDQQTIRTE